MPQPWQTKSSKIVYENPWMLVREDQVIRPDGKDGMYAYAESKGDAVIIIPIDNDGNTYLVQQERYTLKKKTWEFPAGRCDGDTIEIAARRELREEIGMEAGRLIQLSSLSVGVGLSTFSSRVCIALDLEKVGEGLDAEDGILDIQKISIPDVEEMIAKGELNNATSIAALFSLVRIYKREG